MKELLPPRAWYNGRYFNVLRIDYMLGLARIENKGIKVTKGINTLELEWPAHLNDRTGKMIYQGDIFLRNVGNNKKYVAYWSTKYLKWRAVLAECYKEKDFENKHAYCTFSLYHHCLVGVDVIGNINENPELLRFRNDPAKQD